MTLTSKTRRRLIKVRDLILAHPRQLQMDVWAARSREAADSPFEALDPHVNLGAPTKAAVDCGTTCCIAGWFHFVTPKKERTAVPIGTFRDSMGFGNLDGIIYAAEWPEPFASRYQKAKTDKTRARVAAARIDHLLATGE